MSQLQSAAGALGKAGQQEGRKQQGGGLSMGGDGGGRSPISLQQARQMFDPGKFFGALRRAGVKV